MIRKIRLLTHVAKSKASVIQGHTRDWLIALLVILLYLSVSARLDQAVELGYWKAEASKHMAEGRAYKEGLDFAVFRDGTCLHRSVRREWEHAARVNCSLAKQFVEVAK